MQITDSHKVQLAGSVLGVESCYVATNRDDIRVGSSLENELVVFDPLIPPRAFIIRRHKHHDEGSPPREHHWIIEVHPQARVFVNEHLTTRESLMFGDTIALGCHRFIFSSTDTHPRNQNSNTSVNDLCVALLKTFPLPPGFLKTCPRHRHVQRLRRALTGVGVMTAIILFLLLITPSPPKFEPIQLPMEVTILADHMEIPAPDAVRALKDVQRKTFASSAMPTAALPDKPAPVIADADAEVKIIDAGPTPPPPALLVAQASPPVATLPPAELKGLDPKPRYVNRDSIRLAATAPARRLTLREAGGITAVELQSVHPQPAMAPTLNISAVAFTANTGIRSPDHRVLNRDKARRLKALAVFKPSPVRFETASGFQVPVARMSESLTPIKSVTPGDFQIDGKVTEGEIAKSWKSGRFRQHAPGNPPPEANPATYCYVGRAQAGGKPCLYIAFICSDPDTDKIIANVTRNVPYKKLWVKGISNDILFDDSLEVFLDTDNDRRDYNQMIVNARGVYWSAYWPAGIDRRKSSLGQGKPWDPKATVKTSISKEAGQWVCEILIPFKRLGGVPAKGTRWTVNFCRNFRGQRKDWQLQSWFQVYDKPREFHNPHKFGMFEW